MKLSDIEKLIKLVQESTISELEMTDFWGRRVRVSKVSSIGPAAAGVPTFKTTTASDLGAPAPVEKPADKKADEKPPAKNFIPIRSPIVGTFYRAPAPDAPSYVEIGDTVKPGQVVCIVEAMKLMNEIESDVAGKVSKILVKNEDAVEYNQELFLIEPL